ncbi:hypothetical protein [Staphylococcus nepalensis]|uniref:hypothetical protein n=1 Tax=Staphylococcus nepalensis TaxID=214473 RepID=UPI003EE64BA1
MVSFSKYGHYSDDDLKYDMNGSIDGYHLYDGIYITDRVWFYMQEKDMDFEDALNALGLNYDEAIADEEDIAKLDEKRQRLMDDPYRFPFEYDEDK